MMSRERISGAISGLSNLISRRIEKPPKAQPLNRDEGLGPKDIERRDHFREIIEKRISGLQMIGEQTGGATRFGFVVEDPRDDEKCLILPYYAHSVESSQPDPLKGKSCVVVTANGVFSCLSTPEDIGSVGPFNTAVVRAEIDLGDTVIDNPTFTFVPETGKPDNNLCIINPEPEEVLAGWINSQTMRRIQLFSDIIEEDNLEIKKLLGKDWNHKQLVHLYDQHLPSDLQEKRSLIRNLIEKTILDWSWQSKQTKLYRKLNPVIFEDHIKDERVLLKPYVKADSIGIMLVHPEGCDEIDLNSSDFQNFWHQIPQGENLFRGKLTNVDLDNKRFTLIYETDNRQTLIMDINHMPKNEAKKDKKNSRFSTTTSEIDLGLRVILKDILSTS